MKIKERIRRINNDRGMALVVVVLVLVVMTIFGASAASIVYSDNVFSIHQEDTRKAQYLARSAVTVVEESIDKVIGELSALESDIDNAATTEEQEAAMDAYNDYFDFIYGDVLPAGGMTTLAHNVVVQGQTFDSDSDTFKVTVTDLGSSKLKLIGESTVNGKKGKAVRILTVDDTIISKPAIVSAFLFEDALWAEQAINVDATQNFKNIVTSGDVSFDGDYDEPLILLQDGEFDARTEPVDMPSTYEVFAGITGPLGAKTGDFYTPKLGKNGKVESRDITPANNGSYASGAWDGTYNVDTSAGDVVLYFNTVDITGNGVTFNASGDNDFIVYIGNLDAVKDNNLEFNGSSTSQTVKTDIYLFIEEVVEPYTKNNFDGDNLYIYAIDTNIQLKNGATLTGAIIAENIGMKNNGTFTYIAPKNNINNGTSYSEEDFYTLTKVVYQKGNSFWTNK